MPSSSSIAPSGFPSELPSVAAPFGAEAGVSGEEGEEAGEETGRSGTFGIVDAPIGAHPTRQRLAESSPAPQKLSREQERAGSRWNITTGPDYSRDARWAHVFRTIAIGVLNELENASAMN